MKRPVRVLIADDRPPSREGLKALLATTQLCSAECPSKKNGDRNKRGASEQGRPTIEVVAEATDGQEAVRLVEQHRPDVVLMDVQMPVMNGLEATRLIKRRWPEIKVVILTIYAYYRTVALAAGADAFLVKGCLAEDLLEEILDSSLQPQQTATAPRQPTA